MYICEYLEQVDGYILRTLDCFIYLGKAFIYK